MNAPGDTHMHGPVGVFNNGSAPITIQMPCPGPGACPYRLPPMGEPDAKEENEFFRDTGIRAGTMARALLRDLKARHGYLRWRGTGSISRMWQHKTLDYLDGATTLRINPSWFAEGYGWFIFFGGVFFEVIFILSITGRPSISAIDHATVALTSALIGIGAMWVATEHMISPERAARRLKRIEAKQPEAIQHH